MECSVPLSIGVVVSGMRGSRQLRILIERSLFILPSMPRHCSNECLLTCYATDFDASSYLVAIICTASFLYARFSIPSSKECMLPSTFCAIVSSSPIKTLICYVLIWESIQYLNLSFLQYCAVMTNICSFVSCDFYTMKTPDSQGL